MSSWRRPGLPFTGRRVRNSTSYRVCDAYVASGSVIARSADDNRSVILQTFVKRAAASVRHGNHAMPRGHVSNVARGCLVDLLVALQAASLGDDAAFFKRLCRPIGALLHVGVHSGVCHYACILISKERAALAQHTSAVLQAALDRAAKRWPR